MYSHTCAFRVNIAAGLRVDLSSMWVSDREGEVSDREGEVSDREGEVSDREGEGIIFKLVESRT